MTSGFSLTNFLLELRDVRKLFKLWERHQSLIKNAANGHLNYSFGWAPLLRDLKSMFRGMAEFDLRFAGFLDRSGLQQKRYYSASVEPTSYDTPLTQAYWSAPHKLKHEVRCSLRRFGAKLTYNYELPPLSMNAMRTRALLDTLGLNLKPSQIWEAIPFSFVVDWFIKVGGFLQSIEEMDWLNPVLRVESMLYSLKEVGTDTCFIQPWYSNGNSIQVVASHTFSYYTRWFGPVYNSKVELDGDLHPGRVLLGASLFITSRK